MTSMGSNRRGVTLVELLVVALVVTVLITLLLPSLRRSRDAARRVSCQVSLRTLHGAVQNYRNQYADLFPYADGVSSLPNSDRIEYLEPYRALESFLPGSLPRLFEGRVITTPPYWCPADITNTPTPGFSYMYSPWDLFLGFPAINSQLPVSKLLANATEDRLFEETAGRHGSERQPVQQFIRLDGALRLIP